MVNDNLPLCVKCKSHHLMGDTRHVCQNLNTMVVDVVTGEKLHTECKHQRKRMPGEEFGVMNPPNVCGLKGQFFEAK